MTMDSARDIAARLAMITAGSVIAAVGINTFLVPANLLTAGVAGLAVLLSYVTPIPSGIALFIMNIPIFLVALRFVGRDFLLWSLLGMLGLSVALAATTSLADLHPVKDTYLNLLAGGVVTGFGTGLVFRARSSQGGTDVIAAVIRKVSAIRLGTVLFALNASVVLFLTLFFDLEKALATTVVILIEAVVTEKTILGLDSHKAMLTITTRPRETADALMSAIGRGVTFLHGQGAFTKREREIVLCILNTRQFAHARKIVKDVDPGAFTFVHDVTDVIGQGFQEPPI
jgi:uncharacterized membrane-anchored protein YitT (DUF2179 family)